MATVPAKDFAARFDELFDRASNGEEVVVAGAEQRRVRLVPLPPVAQARRRPGTLKGIVSVPPSFFDPLSEEELRLWEGG